MEIARFKRIVIQIEYDNGDLGPKRKLEPARYYADLQAQVDTFHPGYTCILSIPDTQEIVGSQFELFCAYQDSSNDILALNLKLHEPESATRKRSIEELDEPVEQDVFIRHTGRWLNSEVELFHAGVMQYGWGKWARIADYMQTRDRIQVCKFSSNQRAKKVNDRVNLV
jgi:Myb-like DNA-binding domain